jgi:hypothetical protein
VTGRHDRLAEMRFSTITTNSTRHLSNPQSSRRAINVIANGNFSEKPQKLGLNLHGDSCMAARLGSQARASDNFAFQQRSD